MERQLWSVMHVVVVQVSFRILEDQAYPIVGVRGTTPQLLNGVPRLINVSDYVPTFHLLKTTSDVQS